MDVPAEIVLASGSPRRQELLRQIGIAAFTVFPAGIVEQVEPGLSPEDTVMTLSRQKAAAVAPRFPHALVIAADTVVALDGMLLGKPKSVQEGSEMLHALSGRTHQVYTGFTVQGPGGAQTEYERTEVTFRVLCQEEIDAYLRTGEPMDKAGAYGIQGRGAVLVEGIRGDYCNVVGLPVCRLAAVLKHCGLDCLAL